MEWIDCPESSTIARFKYAVDTMVLSVEFLRGGAYEYYDVSEDAFQQMRAATSKGQYLAQNIKGRHRYARI